MLAVSHAPQAACTQCGAPLQEQGAGASEGYLVAKEHAPLHGDLLASLVHVEPLARVKHDANAVA